MTGLDDAGREELRRAAVAAMQPRKQPVCECPEDKADHWFDRSICPDPCGSMHYHCSTCLRIADSRPCVLTTRPVGLVRVEPDVVLAMLDERDALAAEVAEMDQDYGDEVRAASDYARRAHKKLTEVLVEADEMRALNRQLEDDVERLSRELAHLRRVGCYPRIDYASSGGQIVTMTDPYNRSPAGRPPAELPDQPGARAEAAGASEGAQTGAKGITEADVARAAERARVAAEKRIERGRP